MWEIFVTILLLLSKSEIIHKHFKGETLVLRAQNLIAWNSSLLLLHTVSVGWEFKSDFAEWFWLQVSREVAVKMSIEVRCSGSHL